MRAALAALILAVSACTDAAGTTARSTTTAGTTTSTTTGTTPTSTTAVPLTTTTSATTTTEPPARALTGVVRTPDGRPLADVHVAVGGATARSDGSGAFTVEASGPATVVASKPAWLPSSTTWDGVSPSIDIALEPRVVRGLRVSRYTAMPEEFDELLELVAGTAVNTLVFDTKDETGTILYETTVPVAAQLDAVRPVYEPQALIAKAKAAGLYTITRIVTFEDEVWTARQPEAKLAGIWADPTNRANWEYPLALATEACELGFEEIQFDYVRFPAGITGAAFLDRSNITQEERVATITSFLTEAKARLAPMGCGVSAAIFGIVTSSDTDEGIGQMPGPLSSVVDAISPMVYPSHYSPGWLGFADPNSHPGPVVADALDGAMERISGPALLRPWLQAFYYTPDQILAEIAEAESRGAGWILWNASGEYNPAALPPGVNP